MSDLRENVYFSYNFKANYNNPTNSTEFTQGILTRLDIARKNTGGGTLINGNNTNEQNEVQIASESRKSNLKLLEMDVDEVEGSGNDETVEKVHDVEKREADAIPILLSRLKMYNILEEKISLSHKDGKKCLLRAICESAEFPLGESNGVLGDILHVILT